MPATTPTITYADHIKVLIDEEVLNELIPEETRIMALYENTTLTPNWEDIVYNQLLYTDDYSEEEINDEEEDINYEERTINELLQDPETSEIVQGLLQEGLTCDEILSALDELESCKETIKEMIQDNEITEEEVQALLQQGLNYSQILEQLERQE